MVASAGGPVPGVRDKRRIPQLEGVRGICALGVLAVHVAFTGSLIGSYEDPPSNMIGAVLVAGLRGVILGPFFILSGMLLYRAFARATIIGTPKPALGAFFLRRAARLVPAYWVLTAGCLLLLNFYSIDGLWYILRPILMLQSYDPMWIAGMDTTWTVATEVQFYLVLPILAWFMNWLARRVDDPVQKARRMLLPLGVFVVAGFVWTAYVHHPSMGMYPPQYWWPFWATGLFALGMALAVLSVLAEVSPEKPPALFRLAAKNPNMFWLGALVIYAINCFQPFGRPGYGDWESLPASLIQYVVIIAFSFFLMTPLVAPNVNSRLIDVTLSNGVVRYLGRISYGIYLWHFPAMYFWLQSGSIFGSEPLVAPLLRGISGFWELMAAVVAISVLIATVSYYAMERPILNSVERLVAKNKSRPGPVPATARN